MSKMILLVLGLAGAGALACDCLTAPVHEALQHSDAVFAGRVVDIRYGGERSDNAVTFQVEGVWKGPLARQIRVFTASDDGRCGIGFELGRRYLVYANRDERTLRAGSCSRTQRLNQHAREDLRYLGPARRP